MTRSEPSAYHRPDEAPTFVTGNVQISRDFAEGRQIYAGVENVTNYRQAGPHHRRGSEVWVSLLAADNPSFDASIVYAPIFGRNMYIRGALGLGPLTWFRRRWAGAVPVGRAGVVGQRAGRGSACFRRTAGRA